MSFSSPGPEPSTRLESLYFAFGSNLHLRQMARRCPDSRYIGTARLPNFRFQINQRGFANVVQSMNHYVEGLCYRLSANDEARLDACEGVPTAYEKMYLDVELFTAEANLVGRKVSEIVEYSLASMSRTIERSKLPSAPPSFPYEKTMSLTHPRNNIRSLDYKIPSLNRREAATRKNKPKARAGVYDRRNEDCDAKIAGLRGNGYASISGTHSKSLYEAKGERASVLVYVSRKHTQDDVPREEYVDRMNNGIVDALLLGISRSYIEKYLRRYIPPIPSRKQESKVQNNGVEGGILVRSVRRKRLRQSSILTTKPNRRIRTETTSHHTRTLDAEDWSGYISGLFLKEDSAEV